MLLRLFIWIAYLGADMLAVYALGYLARHEDAHPMSFFWAPFLLIHLGGQDTITAFAMEDNKLWLRHLLNLMVQTVLAIYVFWKSMGRHDMQLLLSGIFVFVAGIIKYGERIWALRCGSFESLEDLSEDQYGYSLQQVIDEDTGYSNTVLLGLSSMQDAHEFFVAHAEYFFGSGYFRMPHVKQGFNRALKLMEIELGVMYNDIYTKAFVLRTRSGIILRYISQMCTIVAFVVFLEGNRGSYGSIDVAITYVLFIGGLLLEVCAVTCLMASPWTWAWLKVRKCDMLARLSWFLFSSPLIGWPEERSLWSNALGQYNFSGWLEGIDQPRFCNQQLMSIVKGAAKFFGVGTKKIFWMSKMLETEYIKADTQTMECLFEGVSRFAVKHLHDPGEWSNIGPILKHALYLYGNDFGRTIVLMHLTTELQLKKHHCSDMEAKTEDTIVLVEVCRKLSRYMMYLLVTHPSLLPLNKSAPYTLDNFYNQILHHALSMINFTQVDPHPGKETLEEIKEAWIRLIIYAAAKSRPEMHAAQLAKGGELLTFVWLQLGHYGFGPMDARIQLTSKRSNSSIFYTLLLPPDGFV
ncbi:unnamed protein product [Urochloa decumbens]